MKIGKPVQSWANPLKVGSRRKKRYDWKGNMKNNLEPVGNWEATLIMLPSTQFLS